MKLLSKFGLSFILGLSLIAISVNAENMKRLGNWHVHYIALNSTFMTPEIAKAYNLKRSKYNALINISVLDANIKGNPAKEVSISGTAQNKLGQIKTLEFKEVKEGDAIYYLAEMSYRNEESFKFKLDITDGREDHTLTFSQTMYVEE